MIDNFQFGIFFYIYLVHVGYLSISDINRDQVPATNPLIKVWPASAQTGSYFQIVSPTHICNKVMGILNEPTVAGFNLRKNKQSSYGCGTN
jgi:hypothetical protein